MKCILKIGYEGMDWINGTEASDKGWALVNKVLN